jgi:hypothetical protein
MDRNISNPNDFKVVEVFNSTDFDFTPELGCMYDGKPLLLNSGEKRQYPYHVGYLLATNLAKAVLIKGAPLHDPNANNPVGTPLWGDDGIEKMRNRFMTELYSESRPVQQSQADILMAKVAELEKLFKEKQAKETVSVAPTEVDSAEKPVTPTDSPKSDKKVYLDKAEVIAELTKRGIAHDKRQGKDTLEKLLS